MLDKVKSLTKALKVISAPKIFCISVQRTGTTSVGQFFKDHNFQVATWGVSRKNSWTVNWFKGDYERIFQSRDFKLNQVFEDDPWFCLDFYKVLFHRFPKSKFVLIERDADKWFDSMVRHSTGKTLGNTHLHASIYGRLKEFNDSKFENKNRYSSIIDNRLTLDESHRSFYKEIYENRNREVKFFFEEFGNDRIINLNLEDKDKWQKLGSYFNFQVDKDYNAHNR